MDRIILHCDCNCFYASCELLSHPDLRQLPVAVCGDPTERHGIILAKNEPAKRCGVKTAETIWKAKQKCPGLILLPPHHRLYAEYSKKINAVYGEYTDLVEPFGIDESWLDVTNSLHLFGGDAKALADTLRGRIKREFGLTISVGVSFNKVFAKLGSDYKKPDAVTEFTRENFKELVWPLPAADLLFVGKSTQEALRKYGIYTIGDAAKADRKLLKRLFGKAGEQLSMYANGEDRSPVRRVNEHEEVKSIGNSTTAVHDLKDDGEIRAELYMLSESVAQRLREKGLCGYNVQLSVRKYNLETYQRQKMLETAVADSKSIFDAAYGLFRAHHTGESIRSIGVRVSSLVPLGMSQCSLFEDAARGQKAQKLETTVDFLRCKYGGDIIDRGIKVMHKDLFQSAAENRRTHVENPFKGVAL